jgi:hypothetical protein
VKVENYWRVGVQTGREEYANRAKQEPTRKWDVSDLTDEQWESLEPLLPAHAPTTAVRFDGLIRVRCSTRCSLSIGPGGGVK